MPCGAIRAVYFSIRWLGPIRNVRPSISFSLSIRSLIEITLFKRISFSHVGRSHFFPCFVHVISLIRLLPRRISIWLFRRAARILFFVFFFPFIYCWKSIYRTAQPPLHLQHFVSMSECQSTQNRFHLTWIVCDEDGDLCCRLVVIATNFFPVPKREKFMQTREREMEACGEQRCTRERRPDDVNGWDGMEWERKAHSSITDWDFSFFSPAFSCRFMLMRLNSLENRMNGMTQYMLWFVPNETRQKSKEIMNDDDDEVSWVRCHSVIRLFLFAFSMFSAIGIRCAHCTWNDRVQRRDRVGDNGRKPLFTKADRKEEQNAGTGFRRVDKRSINFAIYRSIEMFLLMALMRTHFR